MFFFSLSVISLWCCHCLPTSCTCSYKGLKQTSGGVYGYCMFSQRHDAQTYPCLCIADIVCFTGCVITNQKICRQFDGSNLWRSSENDFITSHINTITAPIVWHCCVVHCVMLLSDHWDTWLATAAWRRPKSWNNHDLRRQRSWWPKSSPAVSITITAGPQGR